MNALENKWQEFVIHLPLPVQNDADALTKLRAIFFAGAAAALSITSDAVNPMLIELKKEFVK